MPVARAIRMRALATNVESTVAGFAVERELGHGGMGAVYLVRNGRRRPVALKVIARDDAGPYARVRFACEVACVARVRHPNVVRLLAHGERNHQPYAVFEHIDGCDLGRVLAPLPWPVVVHLGRQLAHAVDAVHRAGVLHRDIKPGNVMVSRTCRLTLIDFGLAKLVSEPVDADHDGASDDAMDGAGGLTGSGAVVGTPRFLAPEVRCGAAQSVASDIYAVGLVLHHLLCGRLPDARAVGSELDRIAMPPVLGALVRRCLSAAPADRPASARAVAAAMDGLDAYPALLTCREAVLAPASSVAGSTSTVFDLAVSPGRGRRPVAGRAPTREPTQSMRSGAGQLPWLSTAVCRRQPAHGLLRGWPC